MLQNLYVKNLALIDETEVEFGEGLNILTGETGAGKSLLLGSVHLALGGKYSPDMLRNGTKSGLVELTFKIEDEQIEKHLEEMNLYPEDGFLTLSRRLMEGRSISKINGETVNTGILKDVASMLIDIHGQRDNQTLLHKKNHLTLLDLYGKEKIVPLKKKMAEMYRRWNELKKRTESLTMDEETRRRELSLAEFEAQEIEEAGLVVGEDEELEELYRKMTESRKVTEAVAETYHYTGEAASGNASDLISRGIRSLQEAADFDEEGSRLYEQLTQLDGLLNDFNRDMSSYLSGLEFEEEDFYETEKRLDELNHLKSKYGDTIEKVLEAKEEKIQRRDELLDYDAYLNQLKEQKKASEEALEKASKKLSKIRKKYAKELCRQVTEHLLDLNFETVDLSMEFEQTTHFTSNGYDEVEFLISTNPGETPKPLGKIASGGELSRIMLALKTVLANNDEIETLIFDEIDTGISGRTAQKVSEKLNMIGRNRQVICITHLPQIAAMADTHFLIEKTVESGRTTSKIHRLPQEESVAELARMLGGVSITETVLENAKEMKELAAKTKKS